jgi:hypothetical protein
MALGYQVKLRFMIDQKDSLDNMLFIKDKLNLFLTASQPQSLSSKEDKDAGANRKLKKGSIGIMHRIESNSFVKVPLIIEYINRFRLKTKKKESFDK